MVIPMVDLMFYPYSSRGNSVSVTLHVPMQMHRACLCLCLHFIVARGGGISPLHSPLMGDAGRSTHT